MAQLFSALADFKAVVLDMDGLILDTESGYVLAWQAAARQLGYPLEETYCRSLSGHSGEQIERSLRSHYGAEFPYEVFLQQASVIWHSTVEQQGIETMPGFFDLLKVLEQQQIPYCLATNSRRNNARYCLQQAQVAEYFPLIVTRDEVKNGKPAPDVFLLAAQLLDLQPDCCLGVEDTETGLLAAHRAGMMPILVANKQIFSKLISQNARLTFSSLSELAAWLIQSS